MIILTKFDSQNKIRMRMDERQKDLLLRIAKDIKGKLMNKSVYFPNKQLCGLMKVEYILDEFDSSLFQLIQKELKKNL